ncbi:hypothetical protein BU25DRAFT_446652 [Macroventuria anomochaeta]|uniref:Uncharacterized protein n=1 Tax=Macroventuria anomochaeta TaxID=301207 RepID=A0ACB6SBF9_9PLEO|nr:uncharacterized protein BU25DRAFT_446652 [Macroventuria anomochaeta]KAF2630442.1 hypothetical protein BU25DRAFT_446652 [Macroventuria anomochaeta]
MMTPVKQKRKADDMFDSPCQTPAKRRVTNKPKKRLSIPGAFPTAEPSSQETPQRSAHSVVSARKADNRQPRTEVAAQLPRAHSKSTTSSNRVQKSTTRQPSTPRKQRSSKKLSVVTPKADRHAMRPDVTLRFSFSTQPRDAQGPLKKGRRRGRSSNLEDTRPYKPVLSPIDSPTKRLTPSRPGKEDKVLNRSFSELLVTTAQNNFTGPLHHDYSETPSDLSSESNHEPKVPDPSVFSHPTRKREGYGFSYSEPLWYDSDEYPDTECDWDPNNEEQAPPFDALFDQDSSFDDIVVMRDVGSFHVAKPQRILQCTKATREDTVRLKQRAKMLFKWDESGDVYSSLVGRLERMVYNDLERKNSDREASIPSVVQCASKLRDFLQRNKEERIETGESRRAVEHEIEWASWLVEASRTGVMHLKTKGCSCRPDWEEE